MLPLLGPLPLFRPLLLLRLLLLTSAFLLSLGLLSPLVPPELLRLAVLDVVDFVPLPSLSLGEGRPLLLSPTCVRLPDLLLAEFCPLLFVDGILAVHLTFMLRP